MRNHRSARVALHGAGGAATGAFSGLALGVLAAALGAEPEAARGMQEAWWSFCVMGTLLGCALGMVRSRRLESSERHLP